MEIRQSDSRNDNAAVMRRVADGESFVVTVNGRAVADGVPHRQGTARRRFVPVSELAEVFAAGPDAVAWEAYLAAAEEIFGPDEPTPSAQKPNDHGQAAPRAAGHLGRDRPPAGHVAKVADEVAVSAVTIGELQYG